MILTSLLGRPGVALTAEGEKILCRCQLPFPAHRALVELNGETCPCVLADTDAGVVLRVAFSDLGRLFYQGLKGRVRVSLYCPHCGDRRVAEGPEE